MATDTLRQFAIELVFKSKGAQKKATAIGESFSQLKGNLTSFIRTFDQSVRSVFSFADDMTKQADAIAKTARSAGLTAQQFQRLTFSAERSGVSVEALGKVHKNLARDMRDAAISGGKGGFSTALKEIGLSARDLVGLSLEEKLGLIGKNLKDVGSETERLALMQRILGPEVGPKFASFIQMTTEEIKELGDQAERLGFVMSDEALASAEAYQDSLTNLNATVTGLKRVIGVELAVVLKDVVDDFRKWIVVNKDLIKSKAIKFIKILSKFIKDALAGTNRWVNALKALVKFLFDLGSAFLAVVEALGGMNTVLTVGIGLWAGIKIAMATSLGPMGLILTILGSLAAAFVLLGDEADTARQRQDEFIESSRALGDGLSSRFKVPKRTSKEKEQLGLKIGDEILDDPGGFLSREHIASLALMSNAEVLEVLDLAGRGRGGTSAVVDPIAAQKKSILQRVSTFRRSVTAAERSEEKRRSRTNLRKSKADFDKLRRLGKKGKNKALTDEELFKLIDIAATGEKSLQGLIGTRKIEGGVPPVIAVRINQTKIEQVINAPVTVNGASGQIVEDLAPIILEQIETVIGEQTKEAISELQSVIAR